MMHVISLGFGRGYSVVEGPLLATGLSKDEAQALAQAGEPETAAADLDLLGVALELDSASRAWRAALDRFTKTLEQRRQTSGRGPGQVVINLSIERCWANFTAGSPALRSRSGNAGMHGTFADLARTWTAQTIEPPPTTTKTTTTVNEEREGVS